MDCIHELNCYESGRCKDFYDLESEVSMLRLMKANLEKQRDEAIEMAYNLTLEKMELQKQLESKNNKTLEDVMNDMFGAFDKFDKETQFEGEKDDK